MQQFADQAREVWGRLSGAQRLTMVGIAALSITALGLLSLWVNKPDFTVLYADLDPNSASQIVAQLKEQDIPYELERNGTAILVPSESVYDLRLQLAGQGLPAKDGVGYEIFDNANLGMSDFVQRLNYRRAIEGELSRTIQSLDEVQQARVHIVIPEHRLFSEDQQKPTASVFLKLTPGRELSKSQIQGITYLVASSVEGLDPSGISVVDAHGRLLSDEIGKDTFLGLTASQLEIQKNAEAHITQKVQAMLDGVLGPDNAIVRVHAELNFEQVERSIEEYDPDSPAIRSEEKNQTGAAGTDAAAGQPTGVSSITNYELNKRVEHVVGSTGNITRLSVAVIVNERDGETVDIGALKKLVQSAVGYNSDRQDQIEVSTMPFDTSHIDRERTEMENAERQAFILSIAQKAIIVALVIGLLLFARSLFKRSHAALPRTQEALPTLPLPSLSSGHLEPLGGMRESPQPEPGRPDIPEFSPAVEEGEHRKERLLAYVHKEPEKAAGLVRAWLLEK